MSQPVSGGDAGAVPCEPSNLQVYEAAASMNADKRIVRLALKNRGDLACRLSGYPAIELQDEQGAALAGIAIRQIDSASLSGTVVPPTRDVSATNSAAPVDLVLPSAGEASFEVGWSSAADCPLVSRFTVTLPAANTTSDQAHPVYAGRFTINRALNVCNGKMLITALRPAGSA